jgi:hypothetical protein
VLTPSTGVAIAASSFWATGSAVADPVGEYYVCLEDARPGERYYYDNGASAAAISADRYFVKYTDFVSALDAKHWDNPNKVRKAIAGLTKYRGDQLCADGLEYIPLAPGSGSDLARDVSGKPVIRPVSVRPGALLSTSAFNSMDASGKLSTNALNL